MVGPKGELKMGQKDLLRSAIIITALGLSLTSSAAESINSTQSDQPLFQTLSQAQWKKRLPDLGDASPACDVLAVPASTLAQGTSWVIVTIAGEWQRGGHLRDGNIVAIRAKRFALN
jgi:hypothetical protein